MRRILGFSKAVEALGDFELSEFRMVRELRFYEIENEAQNPRVDLVLESDDRSPNYRLTLAFGGVSGLKIDDFGGPQTRVTGLEVVDIANRQWEGISWEIRDFENSALAFRAASAELTAVIALTT